jgi:uncharacterized membrane protein YgdD (TMEM256/DUF423 family)
MSGAFWLRAGAILGGLAVAAGAFGAHGLQGQVASGRITQRMLENFETAARYQMYHALALLAVGLLAGRFGEASSRGAIDVVGWAFLAGTVIFSGTLYGIALGGPKWLGAITPIGGTALIVGWVALAVAARR